MNLKENKNTKEKKRKEKKRKEKKRKKEHLHYTTVKERKPSLLADLLASQVSAGVYIGKESL